MFTTKVFLFKDNPVRGWKSPDACCREKEFLRAVQGEAGSERLEFHLMRDRSAPLDLTGDIVTFYLTKPDGEKIFLPADVPAETAPEGIAAVMEVRVTAGDGSVLKFPAPDLFISGSDTETAVESTSEFQALDLALNKAEESLQNSEAALSSPQQVLDSDRS